MSIVKQIKDISISIFFLVSAFCVYDLHNFIQDKLNSLEKEVVLTRDVSLTEIQLLRKDTFDYLINTTDKLDNRISSIEGNTFDAITLLREDTFDSVSLIENDIMSKVDNMQNTVDTLATNYSTIPKNINNLYERFDVQTDCEINDLCWQNMTSDLLIDTRNVMRDGSITFQTVNQSVPKITEDVTTMTSSISESTPKITENIADITENINKITKPKWYNKAMSYGLTSIGIAIAAK